jgi:uncharacterized protein YjbI with pentapeptide repeats
LALQSGYCIYHDKDYYRNDKKHAAIILKRLGRKLQLSEGSDLYLVGYHFPEQSPDENPDLFMYGVLSKVYFCAAIFHGTFQPSFIFNKTVDFTGVTFLIEANFSYVEFKDEVEFSQVTFSGDAIFSGTKFPTQVRFSNTNFKGKADFTYAEFNDLKLYSTKFENDADFKQATFHETHLSNVSFGKETSFILCDFFKDIVFWEAEFNGAVSFLGATFHDKLREISSSKFNGTADFSGVTFVKGVSFSHTTFTKKARFEGTKFEVNANFWHTIFSDKAIFSGAIFGTKLFADFSETILRALSLLQPSLAPDSWEKQTFLQILNIM